MTDLLQNVSIIVLAITVIYMQYRYGKLFSQINDILTRIVSLLR